MKEWFSAKEIADLHLPSLPCSERNIQLKSKRENWKSRAREGRGGGKEYHISALPEVARIQLVVMTAPAAKKEAVKTEINPQGLAEYAHIEGRAKSRIDAKLEILEAFKEFQKSLGFANTRARYIFAEKYNGRSQSARLGQPHDYQRIRLHFKELDGSFSRQRRVRTCRKIRLSQRNGHHRHKRSRQKLYFGRDLRNPARFLQKHHARLARPFQRIAGMPAVLPDFAGLGQNMERGQRTAVDGGEKSGRMAVEIQSRRRKRV